MVSVNVANTFEEIVHAFVKVPHRLFRMGSRCSWGSLLKSVSGSISTTIRKR